MTPYEAAKAEACAELDALARRAGADVPRTVTIRIEFDERTDAVRMVELKGEWKRRVLGGEIPSRPQPANGATYRR